MAANLKGRNFITLKDFTPEEIGYLLDLAAELKAKKKQGITGNSLKGKNIALIFEKPSTRTRCAFTVGCVDEGGHPEYLGEHDIQLGHKESVKDTARVLGRMFDGIEFRGFKHATVEELAEYAGVPVWNGLTDDYHPTQILADLLLTAGDGTIHNLHGLFGVWEIPNVLGVFITVLVTVGLVNAYNLIDGVDGLCSGLGAIALTILSGWFFYNNISVYAMLGAGMLGTLVVFFLYNVRGLRLKIFMGDGGSLMLGYTIAFLGLKFYNFNFNPDFFNTPNVPVLALSVVFIPVFDTVRVFTERILRGKSPFYPDKTHVHHLFLKIGYTHLQSTGLILIVAMLFVIFNFLFQDMNINILFFADIILGLVFLNWLPKQVIRRKESLVQGSGKRHGEQKSYKNRNRNTDL